MCPHIKVLHVFNDLFVSGKYGKNNTKEEKSYKYNNDHQNMAANYNKGMKMEDM